MTPYKVAFTNESSHCLSACALASIVAVHVSSVRVAVWPAMVEGLHADVGGVGVTVVLI
jgi:hypothetical protein